MVTIVNDYSIGTWTSLISNKSQALTNLTSFAKMVDVHFHSNIKTLISNNGTEFTNTAFQSFLAQHGILH